MQQEKKYESDARATAPSFGELVEMIKKLFVDYLEDVLKTPPSEIGKAWERYKTLNHLYLDASQYLGTAIWIKCCDRLPGHKKRVKWRDGNNPAHVTDGEISLFEMDKPYLDGWEWYDESPSKEGANAIADKPVLRETIEDIIFSAGRHSQEQCTEIADAILRESGQSKEGNNISKPTFWDVAEAFKWAAEYNDERGESLSLYEGQWTIIEGDGDEAETEDLTPGNVAELYCLQKGFEKEGNKERDIKLLEFIRDCAENWDCDSDSHTYDLPCRKCEATKLYNEYQKQNKQ